MQIPPPGTSQALLDGVVAVIRQQVIADMAAAAPKNGTKTLQARLLTAEQAATYIGRTPGAMRQLIYRREIPVVRIGRNVRIDMRDLDKMIDDNKV
jgi:excisionase family DNA binding protein